MPAFDLPHFLTRPPTGLWIYDVIPCISLVACFPTLRMFWRAGRHADLVLYTTGFLLALVFHALHMHEEGLPNVSFLGIDGAMWRTYDILAANLLLARTFGHALAISKPWIAFVPNVGLPLSLVVALHLIPRVDMSIVSPVTLAFMALTTVGKLLAEGSHTIPSYCQQTAVKAVASSICGMACFAMPHAQPSLYWLWHSLWHVFMGMAYFELYRALEVLYHTDSSKQSSKLRRLLEQPVTLTVHIKRQAGGQAKAKEL